MKAANNRIIVEVDMNQKLFDSGFQTAKDFQGNYRERQPVMCKVIQGNMLVKKGLLLLVHHNFLHNDSTFKISDRIFALNTNEQIFARLDVIGNAHSMFLNIIAERVLIDHDTDLEVPDDAKKFYPDRVRVISDGCGFIVGQILIVLQYADYEIVYNWEGVERRVIRVKKNEIVGYVKKEI
jgi:hypothetical protein